MKPPIEIETDWNRYIELRNSGLKKQANKALMEIVKKIENQGPEYFREFLYSLCEDGLGRDYKFKIQHPLFVRCILPLLVSGVNAKSAMDIVYVVRANASGFGKEIYDAIGDISNRDLLKAALVADPENAIVKNMLVRDYIEELYFGAHHLPDTLITDLETANAVIRESADFIRTNKNILNKELVEEHKYYSELYNDYSVWESGNHTYGFSEWCIKKKKDYSWVKANCYK